MRAKMALLLIATLLAGCAAGPVHITGSITSSDPLAPTVWPPQVRGWQPNGNYVPIQLPAVELHAAGQTLTGELNEYSFITPQGETRQPNDPFYTLLPLTPLTVTRNQPFSLTLTTDQAQAPAAWLWLVGDAKGNLLDSAVWTSSNNTYTFVQPGDYLVKVLAQWDAKNYVSYLFPVVVE